MPNVFKLSAKINTAKYQHFTFCPFTVLNELKERGTCGMVGFPIGHASLTLLLTSTESISRHVSVQTMDI